MRRLSQIKLALKKEQQSGEGAISHKVGLKRGTAFGEGAISSKVNLKKGTAVW